MGTRIQSGAQSNLGLGFLFLYSGLLELFTTFPFENLFSALFYVVVPIVGAWLLAFNGYKHDIKNYKSLCERNDT